MTINFELPISHQNAQFENLYISSQAEDRNIKSEQQVNLILKGFYWWVLQLRS